MRDNIYVRMTRQSWRKERFATVTFTAFVAISVAMICLTAMLFKDLTGAIDHLMSVAKTPDFLQMHTGEIDVEEIEQFAQSRHEVSDFQVLRFLNLDNSILMLGEQSLLDSTQDNGISVQSDGFDYMLDLNNELPEVLPGQVFVPVCYESMYQVKPGDIMKIADEKLTIAGFIRDSQMNSMMASSKRFLVCEEDYEKLRKTGSEEYLIEFLFVKGVDSNSFKTIYENANLPMNGPTITGPLIKIMNTLSDGIMIMIILLISLLILLISLVCIRFMLITRVVAEAGEVGMLKAVGISRRDIRAMFLRRYSWLIFAGTGLGVILTILMLQPLSTQMQRLYGVAANGISKLILLVLSAVLIGSAIILFIVRILRKLNKMTALAALTGNMQEEKKNSSKLCITFVTAIAVFLMMIPSNMYTTLSAPEFVTYMGIGNGQIRMDMREGTKTNEDFERIGILLSEDTNVKEYALYETCSIPVMLSSGTTMNMLMELGNHTIFPVTYSKGYAPAHEREVALSFLLSEELELYPGDEISVKLTDKYEKCKITGVYSDITNGGKTAKIFTDSLEHRENVMWRIAYVTLKEKVHQNDFIEKYTAEGAEVVDIVSRVKGTYGPTLMQIQRVSVLVKIVASVVIVLVIMLFVRMLIANERNQISIQKAMGFKSMDIEKSYWKSCLPYLFIGIALGTVGGFTIGEKICGVALQSLGAEGFRFVLNIGSVLINMVLGGLSAILAVYLGSNGVKKINAVECCRGRE